jgi:tetratricopeptide (TPR) repeat protein
MALLWSGRTNEGLQRADSLVERASAAGDRVAELCGKLTAGLLRFYLEPQGAAETLAGLVDRALPSFNDAQDDLALFIAYSALGAVANMRAQMDSWLDAAEHTYVHAQRAGLVHYVETGRVIARFFGTTPLSELLVWLDEHEAGGVPFSNLRRHRALAFAMLGRFDEARSLLADARADVLDRGGGFALAIVMGQDQLFIELLAGDPAAAAELGEEACKILDELGEKGILSTTAGWLGQALYALDRLDEADAWARRGAEIGASDDAMTQMLTRQVRAKVLARRGESADAEQLAREAVAIGEGTDMLNFQGDVYADLGEVLLLAGHSEDAVAALEQALERYERKGNIVSAQRTRARLADIRVRA